jgi:hypothetical protein
MIIIIDYYQTNGLYYRTIGFPSFGEALLLFKFETERTSGIEHISGVAIEKARSINELTQIIHKYKDNKQAVCILDIGCVNKLAAGDVTKKIGFYRELLTKTGGGLVHIHQSIFSELRTIDAPWRNANIHFTHEEINRGEPKDPLWKTIKNAAKQGIYDSDGKKISIVNDNDTIVDLHKTNRFLVNLKELLVTEKPGSLRELEDIGKKYSPNFNISELLNQLKSDKTKIYHSNLENKQTLVQDMETIIEHLENSGANIDELLKSIEHYFGKNY